MNETQLENLALEWFAETGWQIETGPEIAPDSDRPLREDYKDVLLEEPLKRAILRINPGLPGEPWMKPFTS
jgi:type I restriction enzyme, R subunit